MEKQAPQFRLGMSKHFLATDLNFDAPESVLVDSVGEKNYTWGSGSICPPQFFGLFRENYYSII